MVQCKSGRSGNSLNVKVGRVWVPVVASRAASWVTMWKVGVRKLKNRHLSRAIRRARQGEEIL
jgi:hypothetical protein